MSDNFVYRSGLGSIGSYQISGIPWVSSSLSVTTTPQEISFPTVSKFIVVKNLEVAKLRVGFSENGVNGSNYFLLGKDESFGGDIRVSKLFIRGDSAGTSATIMAGLTGISSTELVHNWSGSAGVG